MPFPKQTPDNYHIMLAEKKKELAGLPARQTQDQRTSVEYTATEGNPQQYISYLDRRARGLVLYMDHQEVMKHEPVRISAGICPSCDRPIDSFTGECGCS